MSQPRSLVKIMILRPSHMLSVTDLLLFVSNTVLIKMVPSGYGQVHNLWGQMKNENTKSLLKKLRKKC